MRRAFLKGVPFKSAPQRAEPSPSEDFVLSAQNKISETNFLRVSEPRFYLKNFLEKSKIALLDFSPDLPQGFREEGEFAAFIKSVPLKHAAKREKPPPSKANGGVALKITEKSFISLKLFS